MCCLQAVLPVLLLDPKNSDTILIGSTN
jgi:hypothetical protein